MANTLQFHLMTAVLWLLIGLQALPLANGAPQTKNCSKGDNRYHFPDRDTRTAAEIRAAHPCNEGDPNCNCRRKAEPDGKRYCIVECWMGYCWGGAKTADNAWNAVREPCRSRAQCSPKYYCDGKCGGSFS